MHLRNALVSLGCKNIAQEFRMKRQGIGKTHVTEMAGSGMTIIFFVSKHIQWKAANSGNAFSRIVVQISCGSVYPLFSDLFSFCFSSKKGQ